MQLSYQNFLLKEFHLQNYLKINKKVSYIHQLLSQMEKVNFYINSFHQLQIIKYLYHHINEFNIHIFNLKLKMLETYYLNIMPTKYQVIKVLKETIHLQQQQLLLKDLYIHILLLQFMNYYLQLILNYYYLNLHSYHLKQLIMYHILQFFLFQYLLYIQLIN